MIDHHEFRRRFGEWLERNVPSWWSPGVEAIFRRVYEDRIEEMREWQARLYDEGWLGYGVPEEYGGLGGEKILDLIVHEEIARRMAPPVLNRIGLITALPLILVAGTEEQKKRYTRPILRGDEIWCQGFSEPGAGSDLAALSCRAERRGDVFVVTGQKVWSSLAHIADYCLLLCRTGTVEERHRGITCLVMDMKSRGITLSPIVQITGEGEFSQLFLDGVEVPVGNVIGRINEGWGIAMTTLNYERLLVTSEVLAKASGALERFAEMLKRDGAGEWWRLRIAELWTERESVAQTFNRLLKRAESGALGPEAALIKIMSSEHIQSVYAAISEYLMGRGVVERGGDELAWEKGFFWSRGRSIAGGTSEVLRNVIAERVLGMAR